MNEWTDIGEQLRQARKAKKLSLEDVAHTTRIPIATLAALEESDYSIFPSPTYARSFLSQYSEFLGVDAAEWVEAFETGDVLSNVNDHGYLQSHHDRIGSPLSAENTSSKTKAADEKSSFQTLTVLIITGLLIGGGLYAYKKFEPMLSGVLAEEISDAPSVEPAPQQKEEKPQPKEEKQVTVTPPAEKPSEEKKLVTTEQPPETPPAVTNPLDMVPEKKPTPPVLIIKPKRVGPPPKAMVIEEDE